jgi:phosphoglycerate dehydrogenase-like enzyme
MAVSQESSTSRGRKPQETKLVICVRNSFSLWNPPPEFAEGIRTRWPEMRVLHLPNSDGLGRELAEADIFVGYSMRPQQLAQARKLKWIHTVSTGVAQLMYPELRQSGIEVTNASSVHCVPMAQHILGVLIALARRFPDCFRFQQQCRWAQQELWNAPVRPREMRGQVLLLIGFGSIGREVARLVGPLGMHIWAVTRSGHGDPGLAEKNLPPSRLHEVLPEADFVVVAAPETPETRGMIGAREFGMMKSTAYFVNVARGGIADEAALIAALEQRAIAGGALDVTSSEPLPPDSPLWKLDNVFLTPHVSAVTEHAWKRQEELVAENLERWFSGCELLNRVDLRRGY